MKLRLKVAVLAVIFFSLLGTRHQSATAQAAVNATPVTVTLSATLAESLSVSASSGSLVATMSGGNANFPTLTVTTTYNLAVGRVVDTYAYFSSDTALSSTNSGVNNTSQLTANVNGTGGLFSSTVASVPFAYSLGHFTTTGTVYQGTATSTITFSIPGFSAWPSGVYTGTLNISAQAV